MGKRGRKLNTLDLFPYQSTSYAAMHEFVIFPGVASALYARATIYKHSNISMALEYII